jgi:hypothetical protein
MPRNWQFSQVRPHGIAGSNYPLPEQKNCGHEGQGYAKQRQPLKSAIHGPV